MTNDSTAPATLAQIKQLLQSELQPMKDDLKKLETKVSGLKTEVTGIKANMATKQELRSLYVFVLETKQHFDARFNWLHEGIDNVTLVLENKGKDFTSKIRHHDKRIKRLEKKAGLAPLAA